MKCSVPAFNNSNNKKWPFLLCTQCSLLKKGVTSIKHWEKSHRKCGWGLKHFYSNGRSTGIKSCDPRSAQLSRIKLSPQTGCSRHFLARALRLGSIFTLLQRDSVCVCVCVCVHSTARAWAAKLFHGTRKDECPPSLWNLCFSQCQWERREGGTLCFTCASLSSKPRGKRDSGCTSRGSEVPDASSVVRGSSRRALEPDRFVSCPCSAVMSTSLCQELKG